MKYKTFYASILAFSIGIVGAHSQQIRREILSIVSIENISIVDP